MKFINCRKYSLLNSSCIGYALGNFQVFNLYDFFPWPQSNLAVQKFPRSAV